MKSPGETVKTGLQQGLSCHCMQRMGNCLEGTRYSVCICVKNKFVWNELGFRYVRCLGANTPHQDLRWKVLKRVGGRKRNHRGGGGCCEAGCEFVCDSSCGCLHGQRLSINPYQFAYCFFVLVKGCEKLFYSLVGFFSLMPFIKGEEACFSTSL